MRGLDWNETIRSSCPLSSLTESLLRILSDKVPKLTIMVRTGDRPLSDNRYVLAHCAKQKAYRMQSRSKTQVDWEEHWVACRYAQLVYVDDERAFIERSKSLLANAPNQRKWLWVFGTSTSVPPLMHMGGRMAWSAYEKASFFGVL